MNEDFAEKVQDAIDGMYEQNITQKRLDEGIPIERDEDGVDILMLEYHWANPKLPWDRIVECRMNNFDNVAEVASEVRALMPGSTVTDAMAFVKNENVWTDARDMKNPLSQSRQRVASLTNALAAALAMVHKQQHEIRMMKMAMFVNAMRSGLSENDRGRGFDSGLFGV